MSRSWPSWPADTVRSIAIHFAGEGCRRGAADLVPGRPLASQPGGRADLHLRRQLRDAVQQHRAGHRRDAAVHAQPAPGAAHHAALRPGRHPAPALRRGRRVRAAGDRGRRGGSGRAWPTRSSGISTPGRSTWSGTGRSGPRWSPSAAGSATSSWSTCTWRWTAAAPRRCSPTWPPGIRSPASRPVRSPRSSRWNWPAGRPSRPRNGSRLPPCATWNGCCARSTRSCSASRAGTGRPATDRSGTERPPPCSRSSGSWPSRACRRPRCSRRCTPSRSAGCSAAATSGR